MSLIPKQPSLQDRIKRIEQRLRALETRRSLGNSSIGAGGLQIKSPSGIEVDDGGDIIINDGGQLIVDGDVIAQNGRVRSGNFVTGQAGWRLQSNGNAEFNDLTLRGGIIGDDALTNPVRAVAVGRAESNFVIPPTTFNVIMDINVAVPDGFTKALVYVTVDLSVFNSSATDIWFFANAFPGVTQAGFDSKSKAPAGDTGFASNTAQALISGLSDGDQVLVSGEAYTDVGTIPANTGTFMNLSALVFFLR